LTEGRVNTEKVLEGWEQFLREGVGETGTKNRGMGGLRIKPNLSGEKTDTTVTVLRRKVDKAYKKETLPRGLVLQEERGEAKLR